jgi:hypothetical protein
MIGKEITFLKSGTSSTHRLEVAIIFALKILNNQKTLPVAIFTRIWTPVTIDPFMRTHQLHCAL